MVDYARMAQTTQRMIEANGRTVTFVRNQRDPDVSARPWRGGRETRSTLNADARIEDVLVIFLEPSSLVRFGIEITEDELQTKRIKEILLVADLSVNGEDLSTYDEVLDRGEHLHIKLVRELDPGPTKMFTVIGLAR